MDGGPALMTIHRDDPVAVELLLAVRGGDLGAIGRLLDGRPGLAQARVAGRDSGTGTLLHLVADVCPRGLHPEGCNCTLRDRRAIKQATRYGPESQRMKPLSEAVMTA